MSKDQDQTHHIQQEEQETTEMVMNMETMMETIIKTKMIKITTMKEV